MFCRDRVNLFKEIESGIYSLLDGYVSLKIEPLSLPDFTPNIFSFPICTTCNEEHDVNRRGKSIGATADMRIIEFFQVQVLLSKK